MTPSAFRRVAAGLSVVLAAGACVSSDDVAVPAGKPGAAHGGALVVGVSRPGSVEPSNAYEPAGRLIAGLACDSLASFDPRTGELKPSLAESWQVSNDGTRLTIRLREGVRFHDGRTMTAEDVVFSLSRAASADYAGLAANLLRPVSGYGEVHGDVETDRDRDRRKLRGVQAVTARTVEIELQSAMADFVQLLGHPITAPVSSAAVKAAGDAFAAQPVCTGPYRVAAPWAPGDATVKLVRFDDYHGRNTAFTAGGRGYVDSVEFKVFPDAAAQVAAFKAGEIDVAHVPADLVGAVSRERPAEYFKEPTSRVEYVGGTLSGTSLFASRAVRIALSQALDRTRLAEEALSGAALPATGFLPPALGESFEARGCAAHAPARADIEAARATLAAADVTLDGARVRLTYNDDPPNGALVRAAAAQWQAALGLEVELVARPWEQYIAEAEGSPGLDGLFRVSWEPAYPSADAILFPLFHSNGIGGGNLGRFASGDVDRIIDRARETVSDEDRVLDYQNVEDLLCEELPLIPVLRGASHLLVRTARLDSAVDTFIDRTSGAPVLRELFVRNGSQS